VEEFAYPYGDVDDAVVEQTRRHFRRAVTTELRTLRGGEDANALPRLDMFYWRSAGQLEAWGTAGFSARLWTRARARQCRAWFSSLGG
jgi:hypothetical protein